MDDGLLVGEFVWQDDAEPRVVPAGEQQGGFVIRSERAVVIISHCVVSIDVRALSDERHKTWAKAEVGHDVQTSLRPGPDLAAVCDRLDSVLKVDSEDSFDADQGPGQADKWHVRVDYKWNGR